MISVTCKHCTANFNVDNATRKALRKALQFQCPCCTGFIPTGILKPNKQSNPHRGIIRNLLVLGSITILMLGGIGFYLGSRKSGDTNTTTQNIRDEIINNAYFQNLVSTGITTKKDLDAIEDIRPYQDGFIGISAARVEWKEANAMAARTGAVVVATGLEDELETWLSKTFAFTSSSLAWVLTQGDAGLWTIAGAVALKEADGHHKVLLHWQPSRPENEIEAVAGFTTTMSGFALIPAGSFTMGRTSGDTDSQAPPAVDMNVREFHIATHLVTWELWNEIRAWGLDNGYTDIDMGGGKGANHPVHSVNWWDVLKWCNARSERDGLTPVYTNGDRVMRTGSTLPDVDWNANGYRLPSSAEWEKAARGGDSAKRFPWGDAINHDHANYRANGSAYPYDTSHDITWTYHPAFNDGTMPYTSPVGSFAPNGYGLYDMAGNVWEWCWERPLSNGTEGTDDSRRPASELRSVLRGGSWSHDAVGCRSAFSRPYHNNNRSHYFGFRTARSTVD